MRDTGFPDHVLPDEFRYRRGFTVDDLTERPKGCCRWCGEPVPSGRRSWCSQECVDAFKQRASSTWTRPYVLKRDRGICASCGLDTIERQRELKSEWRRLKHTFLHIQKLRDLEIQYGVPLVGCPWEADHIVPVIEGGGCCGLENYRTLCRECHKQETARLAARIARSRRAAKAAGYGTKERD